MPFPLGNHLKIDPLVALRLIEAAALAFATVLMAAAMVAAKVAAAAFLCPPLVILYTFQNMK